MEGSTTPSAPTPSAPSSGWSPANPAPLGLAGFAMTTFVLSMTNANIVSGTDIPVVLGLALAYGGLAQLLAGMWEFRAGNTFGAVAFTSYGAFWISYFVLVMFNVGSLAPAHVGHALGLYLWAWAIFTGYMSIAALRLFELLPRHPVVTVASAMKLVETTKPTAGRAIELLVTAGVLAETTGKKRDRSFVYRGYLDRLRVGTDLDVPRRGDRS